MKGIIYQLKKRAKIDFWDKMVDWGYFYDVIRKFEGYCKICNKNFYSLKEFISHFYNKHEGGNKV